MNNLDNSGFVVLDDDRSDLKQEFRKYMRYWPWFVLALTITLSCAYLYIRYASRVYETIAKIKVLDESEGLELPTSAFIFKRKNINLENETGVLTSYLILEKVVEKLKLNTKFYEEGTIQTAQIAELPFSYFQKVLPDSIIKNSEFSVDIEDNQFVITDLKSQEIYTFPDHNTTYLKHDLDFEIWLNNENELKENLGKRFLIKFRSKKSATLQLKSMLTVNTTGESSDILELSINGESKLLSERILDTLIGVFNKDGIKDRQLVSQRTLDFIDERFVFLADELDSIEIGKKNFKQRNNLVDLDADAEIGLTQRSTSEKEVFEVEKQIQIVRFLTDALESNKKGNLLPENIGLNNSNVNNLIQKYNLAIIEKDKLINSGGINNPAVQLTKNNIEDLNLNIKRSINSYLTQLELSRDQVKSRNRRFAGNVAQLPQKEKLLRAIDRQQKIKESLYLLLLQKREEAAINLAITEPSIKVVDYALSTATPITPKPNVAYAAALLAGLLVPFSILYVIFMLDTKIHDKDDFIKRNNKIPIIAEIPDISKRDKSIFNDPNDRTVLAESFRILSSNVNYLLPLTENDTTGKVIYCTSTIKGEGKTFISINLSLALSSMNKKVLLIGADLRNPQIHTHTKYEKSTTGLSDYLHDESHDWKSILVKGFDKHEHHDILLSGNIPPNPTSLLTNGRFENLINEAKKIYDYVIVDTAPTVLVTDTMLISKFADVTVYLARANFTDKKILTFPEDLHKTGKLNNMAYVINGVGASKSYGYSYNYGYGYGYGYTAGSSKSRSKKK